MNSARLTLQKRLGEVRRWHEDRERKRKNALETAAEEGQKAAKYLAEIHELEGALALLEEN